jgi:hypothetical protein
VAVTASVVVVFVPPPSGFADGVLVRARNAVTEVLGAYGYGYTLAASFADRDHALRAAFTAAAALDREVGRVALVCAYGDEDRAFRLAIGLDRDLVPHAIEVLATPAFMDGYAVPAGVGAFRAPGHGHGNEAHVLVDYR